MTFSAVLFDLDGTLLDTALDFETAINRVLAEENRPPLPQEDIRACVTHGSLGLITAVFNIDKAHDDFPRLQKSLLTHYKSCLTDRTALFSGLQSSLDFLAAHRVPWGIVTNKPSQYADPIVAKLLPDSRVLVCPDHVNNAKPDPEGMFLACKKMGVEPQSTLYLGDHLRDIDAGKAAGSTTIAVGWGYVDSPNDHRTWDADYCVDRPQDLQPLFQEIFTS